MKDRGKQIFGKGFLLSERAAADRAAAERAAAHVWMLSARGKEIIAELGKRVYNTKKGGKTYGSGHDKKSH